MWIVKFFRESFEELKKVTWPSRETIVKHTVIIVVSVTITLLIVMAIDSGLSRLVQLAITRK